MINVIGINPRRSTKSAKDFSMESFTSIHFRFTWKTVKILSSKMVFTKKRKTISIWSNFFGISDRTIMTSHVMRTQTASDIGNASLRGEQQYNNHKWYFFLFRILIFLSYKKRNYIFLKEIIKNMSARLKRSNFMIKRIEFNNKGIVEQLFHLQRASYLIEAELINFFDIPPLKETFDELLECGETFHGYFEGEELAGAISYTTEGELLTICRTVVHPNHFRKGIAQKLLKDIEDANREYPVLSVSTGKDNTPAKNLYVKNGYKLVGDIEVAPNFYISNFEKRRAE
jgi:ribosomal protein S18 acetylase RimI-like enzyme